MEERCKRNHFQPFIGFGNPQGCVLHTRTRNSTTDNIKKYMNTPTLLWHLKTKAPGRGNPFGKVSCLASSCSNFNGTKRRRSKAFVKKGALLLLDLSVQYTTRSNLASSVDPKEVGVRRKTWTASFGCASCGALKVGVNSNKQHERTMLHVQHVLTGLVHCCSYL